MDFTEKLQKVEQEFVTGPEDGGPPLDASDPRFGELYEKALEAAQSREELDQVYARYKPLIAAHGAEARDAYHEREADLIIERAKAIEAAESQEELDAAYAAHPAQNLIDQREAEYRKAVAEAETREQLDEIYAEFGRRPATRS